jgi:hypothetical protein
VDGVRITKVQLTDDGRAVARVNGNDVQMMNPLGGWLVSETHRELIGPVTVELNKKVKSLRKGEKVQDD